MKSQMNKETRNWLILIILIAVAVLATLWATSTSWYPSFPFERRGPPGLPPAYENPEDIQLFYAAHTVVSAVNVTLSFILLLIYVSIYRKTRSEFTIGLVIFSAAFLLTAFASDPLVIRFFGFRPFNLGPFILLPSLFTLGALSVLLYLSIKY